MKPFVFTIFIIGFVVFNNLIPKPKTPLIEAFETIGNNIEICQLFDNEIEVFSFYFTQLMSKEEKLANIHKVLDYGKRIMMRNKVRSLRMCKKILQPVMDNKTNLYVTCVQLLENSEVILNTNVEYEMFNF